MFTVRSNEVEFKLYSNLIPITLKHDVGTGTMSIVLNVDRNKCDIAHTFLSEVYLIIDDREIYLSRHMNVYIDKNTYVIISHDIDYIDLFYTINDALYKKYFKVSDSIYYHLKTSKRCNMKCPYCASGVIENQFPVNHLKYKGLIVNIIRNTAERYDYKSKTMCIMGGEPFLFVDEFKDALQFDTNHLSDFFSKNNILIFTNNTANTVTCTNLIDATDNYTNKTIILSMDTLDVTKSSKLRTETQKNKFMKNLEFLNTKSDYRVCTNIMFTNEELSLELINYLGNNTNVKNIQISFDNTNNDIHYTQMQNDINSKLMNYSKKMYNMGKIKKQHNCQFPIHLKIKDNGVSVMTLKMSYNVDENYVSIYEYDRDNKE